MSNRVTLRKTGRSDQRESPARGVPRSFLRFLFLSLSIHVAAFGSLWFYFRSYSPVGEQWSDDALFLILLSAFLVVISFRGRAKPWLQITFGVVRIIIVLLAGYPMGSSLFLPLSLAMALGFDLSLFLAPRLVARLVLAFSVLVVLIYPRPVAAWNVGIPGRDPLLVLLLPAVMIMAALTGAYIRRLVALAAEQEGEIERLSRAVARLSGANVQLQQYASTMEDESVANERNRIAREIHDTLGHTTSTTMMIMEAASAVADRSPSRVREILREGRAHLQKSQSEIHDALLELRSSADPSNRGLIGISKLVKTFEHATSIKVITEYANMPMEVSPRIDLILYRFIQEGLTNAFKHGKATEVRLVFFHDPKRIVVSVSDNGKGAKNIHPGIGFLGMRERLTTVNGTVQWRSSENGFEVVADIPLEDHSG